MYRLFEAMEKTESGAENLLLTSLEEETLGQKALLSDGSLVWESVSGGVFSDIEKELEGTCESGIQTLGGQRVFCDTLGQEKQIVVCGGGHVSMPVIQIGLMLGCQVTVLEDRPKFADNARKAGATKVICAPFEEGLDRIEGNGDTYFVIVTRGHRYDQVCLEKIAAKEHAYIGMIGSRRRVALVKKQLAEGGVDQRVLDQVYTPIGLDIGAETPAEIGVAIMAEIIEVKNKRKRTWGYSREIRQAVCDRQGHPGPKVMATIISRKGSAPQGIGVKMLVSADGTCVGTIGGGCMESSVMQKALLMARTAEPAARICRVDLTGDDAEDEGMVCGGVVEVLLELV